MSPQSDSPSDPPILIAPRTPDANDPAGPGWVVDCPGHALPFGIIFEEHAARRPDELKRHMQAVMGITTWEQLRDILDERNRKYYALEKLKANPNSLPSEVDQLQDECAKIDWPLKRLLHRMNATAVCLSGGGIRSASFGLGVLEALAAFSLGLLHAGQRLPNLEGRSRTGLLHKLDYLSTVSGGGYIGSWLTAWVYRRHRPIFTQPAVKPWKDSYGEVVRLLAGQGSFTSGDPAPRPTRHLRDYTAYLAPAMGLSLDFWDLFAIVLRNLMINWAMLIPLLFALVALPQISYSIGLAFAAAAGQPWLWGTYAVVLLLFLRAAVFVGRSLPSQRADGNQGPTSGQVIVGLAVPVLLANWIVAEVCRYMLPEQFRNLLAAVFVISWIGFATLAAGVSGTQVRPLQGVKPARDTGDQRRNRILTTQMAALVCALATVGLVVVLYRVVSLYLIMSHPSVFGAFLDERLFVIVGLPLATFVPLATVSLFAGLVGVYQPEDDREWWSRAGGIQLAVMVAWMIAHAVTLYATSAIALLAIVLGSAVGGVTSALGWSSATAAGSRGLKSEQVSKLAAFLRKHNLLLPASSALALLLLAFGVAAVELQLAHVVHGLLQAHFQAPAGLELSAHIVVLVVAVLVGLLLNWAININLFSLHGMYRMRLMRAFLGASNTQRNPDAFTHFDPKDTPREAELAKAEGAPLHIHNTTLNLVGTKDLAWRERKAAPFSFSALHSGSWRLGYVGTDTYANVHGPTLATVMAISGAAFNPNMGYHSSPLVTLLMTFFNARLGQWLPNPGRAHDPHIPWAAKGSAFLRKSGPTMALEPLVLEALGMTDLTYRWIELTDGGHFENLGLYEMVLRRCHHIVVMDAGADEKCQFEDLGNALRKIEIDLGIPILFKEGLPMQEGAQPGNRYCAVATIDYSAADVHKDANLLADERATLQGTLVYIKASLNGSEPPDVKQYGLTHPTFPHETTTNQFFNESQFESYRHLAAHAVEKIVEGGLDKLPKCASGNGMSCTCFTCSVTRRTDLDAFTILAAAYAKP